MSKFFELPDNKTVQFKPMQNLDFSHRIQKSYIPEEVSAAPAVHSSGKNSEKSGIPVLTIIAAVTFTLGVMTGFKISDFTNIEKNLIKYPESKKKVEPAQASTQNEISTFANPSSDAAEASLPGKFLIKIGTFQEQTADSLTTSLNNNSRLVQIKPAQCSGVDESIPDRYIAFRTMAGSSGQNVFLGCFQKKWQAQNALKLVRETKINGTGGAQIYEIE